MTETFTVPTNLLWTAGQVAAATGMSTDKFQRLLPVWEQHGFPRRIPGLNKWPRWAVTDWLNSSAGTYASAHGTIPEGDPEIEAIVSELEAAYTSSTVTPMRQVA